MVDLTRILPRVTLVLLAFFASTGCSQEDSNDKKEDEPRTDEPVPPFPYQTHDVTFENEAAEGVRLAGTLAWPEGEGPFRAVVMITGSGPQDRNEELLNLRPFLVLSDALARAGIASLRYDDRGFAESTGDFSSATTEDFASDARAALAYLAGQDHFEVAEIGFLGHSEGGVVAPMAAEDNPDADFLVLLAGTGIDGGEIIISQARAIAAADGESEAQIDETEAILESVVGCIRSEPEPEQTEACLRTVLEEVGASAGEVRQALSAYNTPWMRYFINYDPIPVLERTTIPTLALNGSRDLQVLSELNLPPIAMALEEAGNSAATVEELSGLNHLFQHAETGSPSEYASIEETMAPEVLTLISEWIGELP